MNAHTHDEQLIYFGITQLRPKRGLARVNPELSPTQTHTLAVVKQQLIKDSFGATGVALLGLNCNAKLQTLDICSDQQAETSREATTEKYTTATYSDVSIHAALVPPSLKMLMPKRDALQLPPARLNVNNHTDIDAIAN